jgi:hypothetical protein
VFLAGFALISVIGLAVQPVAPKVAWAKIAPVTTVSGDPDDPEAPAPAPKKSAQAGTLVALQCGAQLKVPKSGQELWRLSWRSILVQVFMFEKL